MSNKITGKEYPLSKVFAPTLNIIFLAISAPMPGQKKKQEFYLMTCTSFFKRIEHRKLSALPLRYASCKMHRMCDIMTPTNRNL